MNLLFPMPARWSVSDIAFALDDDQTDDPIATLVVKAPGATLLVMAEFIVNRPGRTMKLTATHIHGATANTIGFANLKTIALAVLEGMDLDEIVIEGGIRTTGAGPGHTPRPFRFTRPVLPDPGA